MKENYKIFRGLICSLKGEHDWLLTSIDTSCYSKKTELTFRCTNCNKIKKDIRDSTKEELELAKEKLELENSIKKNIIYIQKDT